MFYTLADLADAIKRMRAELEGDRLAIIKSMPSLKANRQQGDLFQLQCVLGQAEILIDLYLDRYYPTQVK